MNDLLYISAAANMQSLFNAKRSVDFLDTTAAKKRAFRNEFHHLCHLGIPDTAAPLAEPMSG